MKKLFILIVAVVGGLFSAKANSGSQYKDIFAGESAALNAEEVYQSQPQPKPGKNKGMRRMRNKLFTVNLFKYNKKIREKRDRELKALAKTNKKSARAHKANKKSKHILLRGDDSNHGFKNKRRW